MWWRRSRWEWASPEMVDCLIRESEAFLNGRLARIYGYGAGTRPAWIEFNWVAHAAPFELRSMVAGRDSIDSVVGSWEWVVEVLCHEMFDLTRGDPDRLVELQRDCLIPLELELMQPSAAEMTPSQILTRAAARLHTHPLAGNLEEPG